MNCGLRKCLLYSQLQTLSNSQGDLETFSSAVSKSILTSDAKIKCSRIAPCRNCSVAGVECDFRADDWKRSPISPQYVSALEARVSSLELLLSSIKTSSGRLRESLMESIDLDDHMPGSEHSNMLSESDIHQFTSQELGDHWLSDESGMYNNHSQCMLVLIMCARNANLSWSW